ncbi:MAG: 2-oxoacid:acceptor oxidoreductase subunit alpha, partial [Candidatus Bathyarchaeia archaeon]
MASPWSGGPSFGKPEFMMGNFAVAEGAIYAGCHFFAGYPITPANEIAEVLAERLPAQGGVFLQMEDELAAINAVIGASLTGAKAMTATSGPGFTLMQEGLGFAAEAEVPCVVVDVQRVGPSTGLPTAPAQGDVMQARYGSHGDYPTIVLAPMNVQELFNFTVHAFNLAERFRNPVIILSDEALSHSHEKLVIPPSGYFEIVNRKKPRDPPGVYRPYRADPEDDVPPMANFGDGYKI